MNIQQTQQVLSYIWSTHPSAPKYSEDGKMRTVAAYFRVLYQYSVDDVMEAVDKVCRESPSFIPSAYEIEKRCSKRINVEAYLSKEYEVLGDRLEEAEAKRLALKEDYQAAFSARDAIMREYGSMMFCNEEKQTARREEYREKCAPHETVIEQYSEISDECGRIKARMDELLSRATWAAQDAYDKQQTQMAHKDLCSLGYDRLALEE